MTAATTAALEAALPPGLARLPSGASLALVAHVAGIEGMAALAFDLPADEEARIARHVKADDRAARRAAWRLARAMLGLALGLPPAAVPVVRAVGGRPRVAGDGDLDFNLTHSRGVVAVGLVRGGRIGVDVEHPRPLALWTDLARDILDPADRALWLALPQQDRAEAALAQWCGKEAVLKATGEGISGDPRSVRLPLGTFGAAGAADAPAPDVGASHAPLLRAQISRDDLMLRVAAGKLLAPSTFACAVSGAADPAVFVLSHDGAWLPAAL